MGEVESVKSKPYATEVALCADFIDWARREAGRPGYSGVTPVWTPYAETAGWDLLLVGPDGTQIGIQAKLTFNLKVIEQCIPGCWDAWHDHGPDYRAILVPEMNSTAESICAALGLMLFARRGSNNFGPIEFTPALNMGHYNGGWHYWSPRKRCVLPEFVPDVAAGASGPVQLTRWKIAALRIIATLQLNGHVTKQDFKAFGIDPRRWTGPQGWLQPGAVPGQFIRGDSLDFDKQHPEVYAKVLAEITAKPRAML